MSVGSGGCLRRRVEVRDGGPPPVPWSTGGAANAGIIDAVWCRSRGLGKAMECDPLVSEHARVEPRSVRG